MLPINGSVAKHKFNKGEMMKNIKSKIILVILAVGLIGGLAGFLGCKEEPITQNELGKRIPVKYDREKELDKMYELVIRAYQNGYLQGMLDKMKGKDYSEQVLEKVTLEYIKAIKLDPKYYALAKGNKNFR